MKIRSILSCFALVSLAGCDDLCQMGPGTATSTGAGQASDQLQTLVAHNQPIQFRDGTVLTLPGVVQTEVFARVPDSERRFRYQKGVRRTIRTQVTDASDALAEVISKVMAEGGYRGRIRHSKEGVIVMDFVKQGVPAVNLRLEPQVEQNGKQRKLMSVSWII